MARHRTAEEKRELGERARALRAAGRSQREIIAELHVGEDLLRQLLAGTEVPDSLRRPRAKDQVRALAMEMRLAGRTYDEISTTLAVSKSSCSLWLRHLPRPEDDPVRRAAAQERRLEAQRARARRDNAERDAEGDLLAAVAGASLQEVDARDLMIAFAISYWCEGAKRKPWTRTERLTWVNSDPALVRLFLEGLRLLGVTDDRISCQVHIHESGNEPSARAWWEQVTDLPSECFRPSTLKRHNPRTVRRNVAEEYRGCLAIRVRRSRELYLIVRGLVEGLTSLPRVPTVAT